MRGCLDINRVLASVQAPICPHCNTAAKLITGAEMHPDRPRFAGRLYWCCASCDAHVGTHQRTGRPLGTLADQQTRAARAKAHRAFDAIWITAPRFQVSARTSAYWWLARSLGVSMKECHFAMLDEAQCARAIELCVDVHREGYGNFRERVYEMIRMEGIETC